MCTALRQVLLPMEALFIDGMEHLNDDNVRKQQRTRETIDLLMHLFGAYPSTVWVDQEARLCYHRDVLGTIFYLTKRDAVPSFERALGQCGIVEAPSLADGIGRWQFAPPPPMAAAAADEDGSAAAAAATMPRKYNTRSRKIKILY